ncbi:MAG: hypothetical protein HOB58_05400, partial [Nitrospina sp.]|nr:hypothetical protein [Nitrospina sp.]
MMFATAPVFAADVEELERRLNIMAEELDEVKGTGGSMGGFIPGPGQRPRRLGSQSKTYINGYGETHYNTVDDGTTKID